jgi:hypothetical protein
MTGAGKPLTKFMGALAISLSVASPPVYADSDLHDLYNAIQSRAHAVTIPAKVLSRLGLPASDVSGKEIVAREANRDQRGITLFSVGGVPYIAMFHIETDKLDAWWIRFSLDGHVLNEKWGQEGLGTFDIPSAAIAEREISFWRHWIADGAQSPR